MIDFSEAFISSYIERKIPNFDGICLQCEFSDSHYSDSMFNYFLGEDLPASLMRAVPKRKAEFLAGRYLSRQALMALGFSNTSIGIGPSREPIWPEFSTGSISHAGGTAICAVGDSRKLKSIGLDIEDILSSEMAKNLISEILFDSEYELLDSHAYSYSAIVTLIFSAKESLFKALFSDVGAYFGFEAARVLSVNPQASRFVIELVQDLTPALPVGSRFNGVYHMSNQKVLTTIVHATA